MKHGSIRNERIEFEEVNFTRETSPKEGKDSSIGRKGDGHRFLGFKTHNLHRLFGKGKNDHRTVL
jgi:hypothetical protein